MYRLIDLFCGAGGMTLGFSSAFRQPFETGWANDFNSYAVRTYNLNFGDHCIVGDICELLETSEIKIPSADVVIGGPPCQGFSLLNKKRRGDRRRKLWLPYLEVVERSGAQVFVMENVPQLLDSPEYAEIEEAARDLGFSMKACKLVAADYGVPQTRTRAFVLASRIADPGDFFPPPRSHYNCKNGHVLGFDEFASESKPWRTVRDAIGDLPPPVGTSLRTGEDPPANLHFGRSPTQKSVERYRAIPEPGMNRVDLQQRRLDLTPRCWINKKGGTDLFGRLWWDRPAFTIRTELFEPWRRNPALPHDHHPPAKEPQPARRSPVTPNRGVDFSVPEFRVGAGSFRASAVPVAVPEASVNKDYGAMLRQYDIRFSGKILAVQSKSIPEGVQ